MRTTLAVVGICAVMVAAAPAGAKIGTTEVSGVVEDADGNPVKDAVVTFTNVTSSSAVYTGKTGKKGTYFIPNLLYYSPGLWNVTVEAEGYAPQKIKVESRKSDKTIVGEYETGLRAGKPHEVKLAAFGFAKIDFVMMSPEQQEALAKKQAEEQKAKLIAEGKTPPVVETVDPMGLAVNKVADGDLEGSLELFEKAIELKPEDGERRELYAKVLYNLERYPEAEQAANEAALADPDRPGLLLLMADIHAKQGDFAKAREELAKVAADSPNDVRVFRRMAWIAEAEGNPEESIKANESIVQIEPDNIDAWLSLGSLYADRGDMQKSEAAFTRVVELNPEGAYKTFFNIGVLIENKSNPTAAEERRALEAFRKATEIKPDYALAHRHLAYALLRSGDLTGARKEFEKFLELEPDARDAGDIRNLVSALPQ
jgi:tetratricopeptide (TPR) repeat protein